MIRDIIPTFLRRLTDRVFEGRNRTRIVMGTDRIKEIESGYGDGGENDPESGTIDIVVNYQEESPNLAQDASRVYISGKTDPDQNFGIDAGEAVEAESAIVSHADNCYSIGRNNVKLVVGDTYIIVNSAGVTIKTNGAITIDSSDIKLGSSNANDKVALASQVEAEFNKIAKTIKSFAGQGNFATPYPPPPGNVGNLGAEKVKGE